jgi:hypothetical protein
MKPLFTILALLTIFAFTVNSQTNIQPIITKVGKLNISVDPRMELLNAAQIQADYPVISQKPEKLYKANKLYFELFKEQAAVKTTSELYFKHRFSYDAPITLMLYLTQPNDLKQQIPFSEYLINRAGGNDNLVKYTDDLRDFALQTKFSDYWNQNLTIYKAIVEQTALQLKDKTLIEQLESYYGMEQNSYNIILSTFFRGGKGPRLLAPNGKYDLFACLQTTKIKDSIPYLDIEDLYYYTWHEFGHSFVNPLTEKYWDKLKDYAYLFDPIYSGMKQQAYGDWQICINEHIIRAIVIRMQEIYNHWDKNALQKAINIEKKSKQFIYIQRIIDKLKDFEKQHNESKITFEQYYPELIKVFDISRASADSLISEMKFEGPINNAHKGSIVYIYPTQQTDTFPIQKIKIYVQKLQQHFNKNAQIISDSIALKTDLSKNNIIVYGTLQSNLWLQKYAKEFPFQIKADKIIMDKNYPGKNLKLISCLPNPQNKLNALLIYTAQQSKDIIDINNVFHGPKDYYLIDSNGNKTIMDGDYVKTDEKWDF